MKIQVLFIVAISVIIKSLFVGYFSPEATKLSNFVVETGLLSLLLSLTEKRKRWYYLPLIFINTIQAVNLLTTGSLIISQTLLNLGEYNDLSQYMLIKIVCQFVIYLGLFFPEFTMPCIKIKKQLFFAVIALFCIVEVAKSKMPLHNFIKVSSEAMETYFFHLEPNDGKTFLKNKVSELSKIPFSAKGKNVILIFAESWSSVVTSKELTPNLYQFQNAGISFDHYFNHTFATYRGLYGQLISGYLLLGRYVGDDLFKTQGEQNVSKMYQNKTESLVSVLSSHNYFTEFMSCEDKDSHVANLMRYLNYDKVVTAEDFSSDKTSLSDKEMYEEVFKEALMLSQNKSNFLLAAHIGGTHFGMDSPDKKYKDGQNSILNIYHNQDYWLGEFLKKFKKSSLAKNTIIVFTADHAAFNTDAFVNAFSKTPDMSVKALLGNIPLIIYKSGEKPLHLDAKNKNSLALVPTILDLLEIRTVQNHFLGNSLFDLSSSNTPFSSLTVSGTQLISTVNGIPKDVSDNGSLKDLVFQYYGYLER